MRWNLFIAIFNFLYFSILSIEKRNRMLNAYSFSQFDENAKVSENFNKDYRNGSGKDVFKKGQRIYVSNQFNSYNINNNETIKVNLRNLNSQYGTEIYKLKGVFKDNKMLSEGIDYYINYTISDDIIYSEKPVSTYSERFKDNYIVYCNYTSYPLNFTSKSENGFFDFSMTIPFRMGSFVLKEKTNGIFYMIYNKNKFILEDILPYLTSEVSKVKMANTAFKNLYVIDQPYEIRTFLVGYTANDELIFYDIILNDFGHIKQINHHTTLFPTQVNNCTLISKVGYLLNDIVVGTDKGLIVYNKKIIFNDNSNTNITSENGDSSIFSETIYEIKRNITLFDTSNGFRRILNITDFYCLQTTVYLLINEFGIKIIDAYSMGFLPFEFNKRNSIGMDLYVNPLLVTKFVGLFIESSRDENEFLIEFNVDDERNPLINKVFVSSSKVYTKYRSHYDMYLDIMFQEQENSLIVIRRGMLNNIAHQSYKLNLNSTVEKPLKNPQITTVYNPTSELNELVLIDNANRISYFLSNFENQPDIMNCGFKDVGFYNITMEKYAESCQESLNYNYAYAFCNFIIYLNFRSVGEDMRDLTILGIVLGSLCGVIIVMFVIFLFIKTQCCNDFSMFSGNKNDKKAPSREELYFDAFIGKNQNETSEKQTNNYVNSNQSKVSSSNFNNKF